MTLRADHCVGNRGGAQVSTQGWRQPRALTGQGSRVGSNRERKADSVPRHGEQGPPCSASATKASEGKG